MKMLKYDKKLHSSTVACRDYRLCKTHHKSVFNKIIYFIQFIIVAIAFNAMNKITKVMF